MSEPSLYSPFCHEEPSRQHGQGIVSFNHCLTENIWRMAIRSEEVLPAVRSGQFVMLRLPNRSDPLLGRPLALYRAESHCIEVVYLVVGKMTNRLAEMKPDASIEFWLPLGNGFPENNVKHTILVAGGIGQTPFLMYAQKRQSKERISFLYGARTANRIACMDDFRQHGIEPMLVTDDGSTGYAGLVTDLIEEVYQSGESTQLFCCGPKPMLQSAFFIARRLNISCSVSLETPMSCGLGICFGCVIPYRDNEQSNWDYRRTCKEGPVFDAYKLRWDSSD